MTPADFPRVVAETHDVVIGDTEVIKRFRSWEREEPDREWRGLELLDAYAPGLAPRPLARWTDGGRPVIMMSRLSGVALGSQPLSEDQLAAVAAALNTLHTAVPFDEVARLPRRLWDPAAAVDQTREKLKATPRGHGLVVNRSLDAGLDWIKSADALPFARADVPTVFGQADGNIGNFIWHKGRCGLVDFEDCGASDRAFEIADLIEHVSTSLTGVLQADDLLRHLALDEALDRRVRKARRLMALYWLIALLPGNQGHDRNPVGSTERQARRVLTLLA